MSIQALRFVDRNGRKILQQAETMTLLDGEIVYDWKDVPFVAEEAG